MERLKYGGGGAERRSVGLAGIQSDQAGFRPLHATPPGPPGRHSLADSASCWHGAMLGGSCTICSIHLDFTLPVKAKADRFQTKLREANAHRCQPPANSRQLLLLTMVNDVVSPAARQSHLV